MKKIRIFPLILLICLLFSVLAPSAAALDEPEVDALAVVLADLDSGEVLFSRTADEQRSPASLTKIMTALLTVEAIERGECSLDDMITAAEDCRNGLEDDSSTANIQYGEIMSLKDVLYCAMVNSANEACNVLARHVSGSIAAFIDLMNQRAAELGCQGTHFADPNGLSNENHYSTASDLCLITREALRHPLFAEVCNTVYYETAPTNLSDVRRMANSNALIAADSIYSEGHSYLYEGAFGVKTGYTRLAGYCLVSTAERSGVRLLAVVMGCDGQLNSNSDQFGNFVDSIALYDWAFANYSYREVVPSGREITRVNVALSKDDSSVALRTENALTLLLPNDLPEESIQLDTYVDESKLIAPLSAGTVLGELTVRVDGEVRGRIRLVNSAEVQLSRSALMRQKLQSFFGKTWLKVLLLVVLVLLTLYFVLVARYRAMRKRYLREKKQAELRRRQEAERRARQRRADVPDFSDEEWDKYFKE